MAIKKKGSRRPVIGGVTVVGSVTKRKVKRVIAGSALQISGLNFGSDPKKVQILFDEIGGRPFAAPFSSELMVTTAPLPVRTTSSVRVCVRGRGTSDSHKLTIRRPKLDDVAPGAAMLDLLRTVDEQAVLTTRIVQLIGAMPMSMLGPARARSLGVAVDGINGSRLAVQRTYEAWMKWAPLQAVESLDQLQTISLLDEIIGTSGLTDIVQGGTDILFGGGGLIDEFVPGGIERLISELDLSRLAGEILENFNIVELLKRIREIGAFISENVISQEGIEDILKIVKPSIEGGASVAIQGSLDAEFDVAQIISGLAGFLGLGGKAVEEAGQVSTQIDQLTLIVNGLVEAVGALEAKEDQLTSLIQDIDDRARITNAEVFANEQKLDLLGVLLGQTLVGSPWIVDDRATRTGPNLIPDRDVKQELHDIEDAVQRLEEKDDRQEQKLDAIEEKMDRGEEKMDRFGTFDRPQEGSIASQRGGGSRVTGAVTAIRTADDSVHLRSAIGVTRQDLADETEWADWADFGRPQGAARLATVSLDLQYEDTSDSRMTALLSARDFAGDVFHREFRGPQDINLLDPASWGDWQEFLRQP